MSTVVECKFAEQTLPAGSSKVTQTGDASCTWSGLPEWDGSWWATLSVLHDRSHGLWVLHRTWLVKGSLAWRMSSNQDGGDVKRILVEHHALGTLAHCGVCDFGARRCASSCD